MEHLIDEMLIGQRSFGTIADSEVSRSSAVPSATVSLPNLPRLDTVFPGVTGVVVSPMTGWK